MSPPSDWPHLTVAGAPSGRRVQYAALPYRVRRDGEVQIRLITSRETRRWVIPKGWPIKGLTPPKTAARESYEEAGLVGVVAREPMGMYSYEKRIGTRSVLCDVLVFPFKVKRLLQKWPERFQRYGFWFSVETAAAAVQEPDLTELILSFGAVMARRWEEKQRKAGPQAAAVAADGEGGRLKPKVKPDAAPAVTPEGGFEVKATSKAGVKSKPAKKPDADAAKGAKASLAAGWDVAGTAPENGAPTGARAEAKAVQSKKARMPAQEAAAFKAGRGAVASSGSATPSQDVSGQTVAKAGKSKGGRKDAGPAKAARETAAQDKVAQDEAERESGAAEQLARTKTKPDKSGKAKPRQEKARGKAREQKASAEKAGKGASGKAADLKAKGKSRPPGRDGAAG
ncbi:NUDIX domain-containing protein [Xanthobacter sp. KR7-65]|uniref:NUDIX hydrolase n=1 Tax=Xanthobacter sp. KR7-65 TaxID=3156612 RepID=UPI0032B4E69A